MKAAEIGVFGGSGFYSLMDSVDEIYVGTPYGDPSDNFFVGDIGGRTVAFLPRHGRSHTLPPHKINYRANVWAMKHLGVRQILAPCACGSLRKEVERGDLVICDQYVDRTWGRADTFYDGPQVVHVSGAEPFCPRLRAGVVETCHSLGYSVHDKGTMVVVQGPRFSTKAESRWFSTAGWDVINMTAFPEVHLARELELCYTSIALVTDYDAGLADDLSIRPVTSAEVLSGFAAGLDRLREILFRLIPQLGQETALTAGVSCGCSAALEGSIITAAD